MTHGSGIATDAPIFSARSKIVFTGVEASGSARPWSSLVSRTTVNLRPAAGSSVGIAPTTRPHLEGVATLAHGAQVGPSWPPARGPTARSRDSRCSSPAGARPLHIAEPVRKQSRSDVISQPLPSFGCGERGHHAANSFASNEQPRIRGVDQHLHTACNGFGRTGRVLGQQIEEPFVPPQVPSGQNQHLLELGQCPRPIKAAAAKPGPERFEFVEMVGRLGSLAPPSPQTLNARQYGRIDPLGPLKLPSDRVEDM